MEISFLEIGLLSRCVVFVCCDACSSLIFAKIAECLTMTEAQIFYQVAEHEFLDNAFADDRRAERAPHLSKLAARFNSIS